MCDSEPTRKELEQEIARLRARVAELEGKLHPEDSRHPIDYKSEADILAAMLDDLPGLAYRACAEEGYRLHYASRGCETLLGYTVRDLTQEPRIRFEDVCHPEDADRVVSVFEKAVSNKKPFEVEFRARCKDGTEKWILQRGSVHPCPQFDRTCLYGFATDFTRQRAERDAFEALSFRFKLATESAGIGVWDWNIAENVLVWDEGMHAIYGVPPDVFGGVYETWKNSVHPEDREAAETAIRQALEDVAPYDIVFRVVRPGGDVCYVEAHAVIVRDDAGKPLRMVGVNFDVTREKQAEEALRRREQYLHTIIQATADGFWVVDCEGRLTDVNDAYCAMSGYSREEFEDMHIGDVDAVETPGETAERIQRIIANGSELFDTEHRRKDGSTFPVEVSATYLDEDGGKMVCFCRDISERLSSERALRESEARLKALFDSAPDMIFMKDPEHRFTHVNRALLTKFGVKAEDVIGRPDQDFFPPDIVRKHQHDDNLALQGKTVISNYVRGVGGRQLTIETIKAPVYDADGRAVAVCGISRDITARIEAERALRESEARNRMYVDSSPLAIFVADEEGRYVDVNPAACRLLGYTREELLSMNLRAVADGVPESHTTPDFERLKQEGRLSFERKLRRKDGSTVDTLFEAVRLEEGRYMAFCNDLTERKSLQEQLQAAQKMEAIGQLAGGIAHDFNNLLQVINGHADFALSELDAGAPASSHLERIAEAGERAGLLVGQLLSFSRRQLLRPTAIDPNDLLHGILRMLERVIGENIHITFRPCRHCHTIQGDWGMLEQVLMNLCINARDAMPQGGELRLEAAQVQLDTAFCTSHPALEPGSHICLTIADTGTGMDESTMQQIFEPFFTTKDPGKGTGLGLATAYGIVQQHSGAITVRSTPGQGTEFQIFLPATAGGPPKDKAFVPPAEEELPTGTETILLAEDDAMVRGLTQAILQRAGYTVLLAPDGEAAVRLFAEHQDEIALVLLDVVMPNLGGVEAWQQIAALRPETPAVFASGYSEGSVHKDFIIRDDIVVIQKPFERASLLRALRKQIDKAKNAEPPA